MNAIRRQYRPSSFVVAWVAHPLGTVLPVGMRALCDRPTLLEGLASLGHRRPDLILVHSFMGEKSRHFLETILTLQVWFEIKAEMCLCSGVCLELFVLDVLILGGDEMVELAYEYVFLI